jgi:hypothetical protein
VKENQASLTSMITAYMRAYHSMHSTNKIFDDFLAYSLIPDEKRVLIEQHYAQDSQLNKSDGDESGSDLTNIHWSSVKHIITPPITVFFFSPNFAYSNHSSLNRSLFTCGSKARLI